MPSLPRAKRRPTITSSGLHHPPAGLQRILLFQATRYNETDFDLVARLAGRVLVVSGGNV
jgi:hypothetical protein